MKRFKRVVAVLMVVGVFFSFVIPAEAATSATVDLGGGYSVRIDAPHNTKTGKWHGHVYKKGKQVGAENVDGTKHDGKTFKNVPKKTLNKLKSNKKWKQAKSKNDKLVKQRSKLSWSKFVKWLKNNFVILTL